MFVLGDILEPLRIITERSQSNTISIVKMLNILKKQKSALLALKNEPGISEQTFNSLLTVTTNPAPQRWTQSMGHHVPQTWSIYGHKLAVTPHLVDLVEKAKIVYIDTVVSDLEERFVDMNLQVSKLDMFHNLTKISVQEIQEGSRVLSELYHVNATKLENEIKSARAIVDATNQTFSTFQELAHFLLTELPKDMYELMHKFLSIVLVLPFSPADCERAFSAMNAIKSAKRNWLGDILRVLMMIHTARPEELRELDRDAMAKHVAHTVTFIPIFFSEHFLVIYH